jgi:3-oxoacyl-[acyl-carrier protein] reductase
MDLKIKDKTALVTGASAGLGYAAAVALNLEGARVAICSRDESRIRNAAKRISGGGPAVMPFVCDLTIRDNIERLIADVNRSFGRIDILVANCGGPPVGRHDSVSEEDWQTGYNRTFMSAIRLIESVIPGMKERHFGRIILITSVSAKQPIDNLLLSNSYRAGLLGYAKTVSKEVASFGVTVNTVMPGYTRTERLDYLADEISAKTGQTKEQIFAEWANQTPTGRLGKPEELAALVTFLASEQAAYITGTTIAVDGGRTAGI